MSAARSTVVHMFDDGSRAAEKEGGMSMSVQVREFDGGRTVEMTKTPGFVVLETGSQAFAFDEAQFLHQIKRLFGIAFVVTEALVGASRSALPEP